MWPPGPRTLISKQLGREPLARGLLLGQCSHRSPGPLPGDPTEVRPLRDSNALRLQVDAWEPQGDWVGREPLSIPSRPEMRLILTMAMRIWPHGPRL